jgi:CRISPR-associated protein Cmr4
MYQIAKPLFLICETPLHAGSGSDLGIVDLPIQRERHTDFPKIEGSSLKGALRAAVEQETNNSFDDRVSVHRVFGYDDGGLTDKAKIEKALGGKTDFAGAIGFTDARLLLFPVKSMKGVFAWVTCEKVLNQFLSDMKQSQKGFDITGLEVLRDQKTYIFNPETSTKIKNDKIVLEEYTFTFDKELRLNDAVKVVEGEKKTNLPDWFE